MCASFGLAAGTLRSLAGRAARRRSVLSRVATARQPKMEPVSAGRAARLAWREDAALGFSVKRDRPRQIILRRRPMPPQPRRTDPTAQAGHADRQEPPVGILVGGDDEARGSKPCRHRTRGGAQGGARDLGRLLEPAAGPQTRQAGTSRTAELTRPAPGESKYRR